MRVAHMESNIVGVLIWTLKTVTQRGDVRTQG